MSRITDYGFLFQTTFGTSKTNLVNNIQLSQMNSSSVQKQLKAAGIDTNSKKYKAALSEMMNNGNVEEFDGISLIVWTQDNKIKSLKEFGCNLHNYNPYRDSDIPVFREEKANWF